MITTAGLKQRVPLFRKPDVTICCQQVAMITTAVLKQRVPLFRKPDVTICCQQIAMIMTAVLKANTVSPRCLHKYLQHEMKPVIFVQFDEGRKTCFFFWPIAGRQHGLYEAPLQSIGPLYTGELTKNVDTQVQFIDRTFFTGLCANRFEITEKF